MKEKSVLFNRNKKVLLPILGLLQGSIGNYFGLLGLAAAFPQTKPNTKDYEEDMFFVPFGYIIMLIWGIVTISSFVLLRKNKANLLSYTISWIIGLIGFFVVVMLY